MPSSSPPATRRGRKKPTIRLPLKAFRSWQPPSGRDWAGLPPEMISHVFHMLDPVELLLGGAAAVCRSWRRAARDEPELWRRIDVRGYGFACGRSHVPMHDLVRVALRRSAGTVRGLLDRLRRRRRRHAAPPLRAVRSQFLLCG
ncbi:hypothetical protein ACP70R_047080 [Stipagrostis hirtigluma subsp. patula]